MSDTAFSLDCDDFSLVSSLSSHEIIEPQMYDLLSVGEHDSSAGKYESRCQIELEDIMITNFSFNQQNISDLRSFGAFHQSSTTGTLSAYEAFTFETRTASDEYTFETIQTDDVSIVASVMDCESMSCSISNEVHDEEKVEEPCEDHESRDDNGDPSRRSQLDQTDHISGHSQIVANGPATRWSCTDGDVSTGVLNSNACYVENERIQRARARRFQALQRYQDFLQSTRSHTPTHHEEPLNQQVIENMSQTSSRRQAPLIFRSQQIPLTPETRQRKSVNELRSRQQKSFQDLICAFDKVRKSNTAAAASCTRQTREPRVRQSWSLNPAGRWNK